MNRTVGVWFDGGGPYGFGNIRRSMELAQVLEAHGHTVHCVALSERAAALCPLPRAPGAPRVEYVILDAPYPADALVKKARQFGARVIALDYEGTDAAPDLAISLQSFRPLPPGTRSLCGIEYAIIRKEFRTLGRHHEKGKEVLAIVGGGDLDGLAAQIIGRLPGQTVCVVQGPAGRLLSMAQPGVRCVTSPPDLPQLMARCAWGVTTGGTTMLEMLCLGKVIHVVPRTDAELKFATRFAEAGALLGLGLESLAEPSGETIQQCEARGPEMVDGAGCERIVAMIDKGL